MSEQNGTPPGSNPEKDNTRKVITVILVGAGMLIFAYAIAYIPDARTAALTVVGNWVSMALVWYYSGKKTA